MSSETLVARPSGTFLSVVPSGTTDRDARSSSRMGSAKDVRTLYVMVPAGPVVSAAFAHVST